MICLKCDELTGMTSSGYRKCKLLLREIEDVRLEQDWCPKSAPERGEGMICENCGSPIRLDGPNKKDATLDRILERMEDEASWNYPMEGIDLGLKRAIRIVEEEGDKNG